MPSNPKTVFSSEQRNTFIKTNPMSGLSSHDSYSLFSRAAYKTQQRKHQKIRNLSELSNTTIAKTLRKQPKWRNSNSTNHGTVESIECRWPVENCRSRFGSSLHRNLSFLRSQTNESMQKKPKNPNRINQKKKDWCFSRNEMVRERERERDQVLDVVVLGIAWLGRKGSVMRERAASSSLNRTPPQSFNGFCSLHLSLLFFQRSLSQSPPSAKRATKLKPWNNTHRFHCKCINHTLSQPSDSLTYD